MPVIEISSLTHPGVEIFSTLTEAQLRNRLEPDKGLFIAESPKVIKVALDVGYEPLALLCEHKHIYGDAAEIIERCGDIPVYTSGRELLAELTGYVLTRGVLCAMRRPVPKSMEDVCRGARRIAEKIDKRLLCGFYGAGIIDTRMVRALRQRQFRLSEPCFYGLPVFSAAQFKAAAQHIRPHHHFHQELQIN